MATAYASLVSIMQILDDLQNHPRPPISIHNDQVQSLTQIVTFLQEFLEVYHNHAACCKQVEAIADAAHAVEDVIESHIVDQILADGERISPSEFYEALQKVIDDIESVKREIMDMKEKMGVDSSDSAAASTLVASSDSASVGQSQPMVGLDDILLEVLNKLTSNRSSRQIISIKFGKENCPLELNDIGRNIVRSCKGLPLSIAVVGGILAKSDRTHQHWENIAENLNSILNLENNEHCLQILYMSYTSLPIHLKSCFLSLGYYAEDEDIPFIFVIQMLDGDGIVRPIYGKSLDQAAKEYLTELIERNLLLNEGDKSEHNWMLKSCKIHDLLRDLCLRECEKQKFLMVEGDQSSRISHNIRRIHVPKSTLEEEVLPILESNSLVRSLILDPIMKSSVSVKLLRVAFLLRGNYNLEDIVLGVNLRLIFIHFDEVEQSRIPSSIFRLWNLQTLFTFDWSPINELDIWNMPQLRMIVVQRLWLSDPPSDEGDMTSGCIILKNLHTLTKLHNFKCSEEVVKRIPHIKVLVLSYEEVEESSFADYYLNNLGFLLELEHLVIEIDMQGQIVQNLMITFPHSLKILCLEGTILHWDDVSAKIGSLPLLQDLQLSDDSCIGARWETAEGQFCSLESLEISNCGDLEYWITEE